jgi:alpha-galactosidase
MKRHLILLACLTCAAAHGQKADHLAFTPPMGWNSWNHFGCDVDEELVRETADAMVASGMRDAGYRYVVIDDCWHGERDEQGFIRPDPERFPSGMKALADYVHSRGLLFGLYSDAGWKTCAGRPGSRGREYQDAETYAEWGVDYLKYDWCNTEGLAAEGAYLTMRDALHAAGRPVVFSICEWGNHQPWEWAKDVGHLWRTTGDIFACFDCVKDHGTWSSWGVLQILDKQEGLRAHAGPGHWNDPDMMEVGNGMSAAEDRAHFSMWAMLAAPLVAGNDLRNMSDETVAILTNPGVIAVDQDPLGIQGFKYSADGGIEVWFRPLIGGHWAMAVLNRNEEPRQVAFDFRAEKVVDSLTGKAARFDTTTYELHDLWSRRVLGTTADQLAAEVGGHDVLMVRLVPAEEPSLAACIDPEADLSASPPPDPACANEKLTSYDSLLVFAPHPDDETLGFGGLVRAYLGQGKRVDVIVTTDGDAYCDACRFWKSGAVTGPTCDARDLSNFGTPEIDSFAEVRRSESRRSAEILGAGVPTFLGYPDTGLAAAWRNLQEGATSKPLRRSDFSACPDCETCAAGYGGGPETDLSAEALMRTLGERLAATSERTLLATTHWLDGHGDHAALGSFVKKLNGELDAPRAVAYTVIHAHTPKDTPHSDCWYPGPRAPVCPCFLETCAEADPTWLPNLRAFRQRPDWPGGLPDDAEYGEESHLCLPEEMYSGDEAIKLAAVNAYGSQLGFLVRGGPAPPPVHGLMDCNGYLISFVRRTEAFALVEP